MIDPRAKLWIHIHSPLNAMAPSERWSLWFPDLSFDLTEKYWDTLGARLDDDARRRILTRCHRATIRLCRDLERRDSELRLRLSRMAKLAQDLTLAIQHHELIELGSFDSVGRRPIAPLSANQKNTWHGSAIIPPKNRDSPDSPPFGRRPTLRELTTGARRRCYPASTTMTILEIHKRASRIRFCFLWRAWRPAPAVSKV